MLAALLRPLFSSDSGEQARGLVGDALERMRKPLPKVAALLEEAEEDLLALYGFPADHWPKLRSTNPVERINREIGRRTDVVGIFPNDRALLRLAASVVIEQNDEWPVGRRSATTRWTRSSIQKQTQTKTERSPQSSPRPEQPTIPDELHHVLGLDCFLLNGPYASAAEQRRIDGELRELLVWVRRSGA
jgi:hypothetical protein